jgi:hypothetical protein
MALTATRISKRKIILSCKRNSSALLIVRIDAPRIGFFRLTDDRSQSGEQLAQILLNAGYGKVSRANASYGSLGNVRDF